MDYIKLKSIIDADATNAALSNAQIAAKFNAKTTPVLVSTSIGIMGFLRVLGGTDGPIFLDAVDALTSIDSELKWVMKALNSDKLDIAEKETQIALSSLVSNGVTSQAIVDKLNLAATKMKSIAEINGFIELIPDYIAEARRVG